MHKNPVAWVVVVVALATSASATDWNYGRPSYAARNGEVRAFSHGSERISQQPDEQLSEGGVAVPRNFTTTSRSGNAPPLLSGEELETLKALYKSLGGPNLQRNTGWMSASNPCGNGTSDVWYGVECSTHNISSVENSSSHVTRLVLPQNNVVGRLPPLRGLQHLIDVDFDNSKSPEGTTSFDNSVGGTLDALCGLGSLSTVLFASNNMTGSIPECVQSMAKVTVLDLNYNAIHGATPDELCSLSKLKKLHLRGNRLQGTVPVCIGEALTALRILDYSNLDEDYRVVSQSLFGTLPTSLCDLEHLEVLLFQDTHGLHGTLPAHESIPRPNTRRALSGERDSIPASVRECLDWNPSELLGEP